MHQGKTGQCAFAISPDRVSQSIITFEQPVSERVRTMLRLEHLFAQLAHHREDHSAWGLRASIAALIDILSLFSRNDLKTEILRELRDKREALAPLRERSGVNTQLLDETLDQLDRCSQAIHDQSSQQISQTLKESEFLLAIINRSAIPGGTSHIDMPSYHRWLQAVDGGNHRDLDHWLTQLSSFEQAIALYLQLLRQSSGWQQVSTEEGMYVHVNQEKFHLIRVAMAEQDGLYPEISAGRQRFTVRFMRQTSALQREHFVADPISFQLSLCSL